MSSPTPRQVIEAVEIIGEDRAYEITGPGFLSGASLETLTRIVAEARG